ncbi:MAG: helix-turn-helix domain-containing protein [bacterium]|nr:helix-turn-helix domain-containing protein [bacterium]
MTTNDSDSKLLLPAKDAAATLGISRTTLHRHVHAGRMECVRFSKNSVYFTRQQLDEFIERHKKRLTPRQINLRNAA